MRAVTNLINIVATGLGRLRAPDGSTAAAAQRTAGGAHEPIFIYIATRRRQCISFAFCVGVAEEAIVAVKAGIGDSDDRSSGIERYGDENVRRNRRLSL